MTVQEIQEIGFEKAVFGGYDMKSVDTFLERVAEEFAAMQKENAAMKAKMKVLVDKIEEYRGRENNMGRVLSIAEETLDRAKQEADAMVAKAKQEAASIVASAKSETADNSRQRRRRLTPKHRSWRQHEKIQLNLLRVFPLCIRRRQKRWLSLPNPRNWCASRRISPSRRHLRSRHSPKLRRKSSR